MMIYSTETDASEAFIEQNGDNFIDFIGQNCNDLLDDGQECAGWQIGERRCDCGNRRVNLVVDGDATNGFYAYAEAY